MNKKAKLELTNRECDMLMFALREIMYQQARLIIENHSKDQSVYREYMKLAEKVALFKAYELN